MSTSNPPPSKPPAAAKPAGKPPVAKAAKAAPAPIPALEIGDERDEGMSVSFLMFNIVPSTVISFVTHMLVVMIMAFIVIPNKVETERQVIVAKPPEAEEVLEEFKEELAPELNLDPSSVVSDSTDVVQVAMQNVVSDPTVVVNELVADTDAAAIAVDMVDFGDNLAPKDALAKDFGSSAGSGLSGRGAAMKGSFNIKAAGGTDASQKAVAMALKWLADHQLPDGSWNFDHGRGPCANRCSEAGEFTNCTTGATGLALLPFLGAGQTHREGQYKKTVERGLYYLVGRMKVNNGMGSLAEGESISPMYAHGVASIVLCEGYAMTHDKGLLQPAQYALNFTMYAQDPVGGGWRYRPREPGDTSAVGWQLMALKSGHMAYLKVNGATIQGAVKFLNSVQSDGGAKYGYMTPGEGPAQTAIGLLSRMYLGWKHDNPAIKRGAEFIGSRGPSGDIYYDYYATQVMRHYGGEIWDKWNEKMREMTVKSQETKDHAAGSWYKGFEGGHGPKHGGRLYVTSLATMILEVYYRHMPIYGSKAAEEDFPL